MRSILTLAILLGVSLDVSLAEVPDTGVPSYNSAIAKGAAYLRKSQGEFFDVEGGYASLIAYALIKAGDPPSSQIVQRAVNAARAKVTPQGQYRATGGIAHGYVAGIDAMLLSAAGGKQYQRELAAIASYIQRVQLGNGGWDYGGNENTGDTSMAQYAALGLWAAAQAGVPVPTSVWDKMASWHFQTQNKDGGFGYKPISKQLPESSLAMSISGASTLSIARLHLYPDSMKPKKKEKPKKKFGVLEKVDVAKLDAEEKKNGGPTGASTPLAALTGSAGRAIGWVGARFRPINDHKNHALYYVYAMERAFALNRIERLGNIDWYRTTGDALLKLQTADGSFIAGEEDKAEGTAFAILFYVRATKKAFESQFGNGLLKGDRGLKSLDVTTQEGEIKKKKNLGPLDDLLEQLSSVDDLEIEEVQKAIIEKVQVGDREKLIQERDTIIKIVDNKNPDIRRTAVWALGRTENVRDARLLIGRIKNDDNVDVIVEARYALCSLARRPNGFNIRALPFGEGEYDSMTEEQRQKHIAEWRKELFEKWSGWYLAVRPFEERDDIAPFDRKYRNKPAS